MTRVFIAEKPSLAQAIFEGLGGDPSTEKQQGYFQHNDDIVTWCYGHMLELFDPQDYDPKYQQWVFDDLPIQAVMPPKLKPKKESKAQLSIILKLIDQADSIVHAGDPDEEGCLLIDEILGYANNTKPVERVLIADLNLKPVQQALANMRPNSEFQHMTNSALARSIGDQNFGYNLTRAFTLKGREKGFDGVLNVGRVQSAVLGLVNNRTLANQQHQESYYYDVHAIFNIDGQSLTAKYQPGEKDVTDDDGRIINESSAKTVQSAVINQPATITEAATKADNQSAPLPYNLSALQQLCAKKFGYSAEETLGIMQSLYETHKLLTYPRTDCRYLSEEHLKQRPGIFAAIQGTLPELAQFIDHEHCQSESNHKAFNASKIIAHHAIVPTEKSGAGIQLSEKERNIYDLISRSYIALFYPVSSRDKTRIVIQGEESHHFVATQSVLTAKGWEVLFKGEHKDESVTGTDLSQLTAGTSCNCDDVTIEKKKTKPPKYFTESTLLGAMTRAAKFIDDPELRKDLESKDKDNSAESGSIGTEATRAGILAKLAKNTNLISIESEKGYKEKVWKTTQQGQEFCAILPKEIIAPDTSAIWAGQQAKIREGTLSVDDFVRALDMYIAERIAVVGREGVNISSNMTQCPKCQTGHLRKRPGKSGFFWGCNRYPECDATFPDKSGKPNFEKKAPVKVSDHPCPNCGKGLVRRPGKRIKGKSSYFWGCSGYPECKTTVFDKAGKPNFATTK